MSDSTTYFPTIEAIETAAKKLEGVAKVTPLVSNVQYSLAYDCNISFKREDLQVVRSYKIRGAYNKMSSLTKQESANGVVCASAGNHAQGVALSCKLLKIQGTVFMPTTTPKQKIERAKMFGEHFVKIVLTGDSFDDAYNAAIKDCTEREKTFIHPFNDEKVIEGQATLGLELINQAGIRQQYIDQSVSLNLAFPSIATPKWINKVHFEAWKKGIKTLYYTRTESVLRGDIAEQAMDESCLSCDG